MRVLPILFNTEMVKAILDGRKTVTRRLVKFLDGKNPNWTGYVRDGLVLYNGTNEPCNKPAPFKTGDILYVRETWSEWTDGYVYKAWSSPFAQPGKASVMKWHPSLHMPKEAARIFLKVKAVRVERLQKMKKEDCEREGLEDFCKRCGELFGTCDGCMNEGGIVENFKELWNSTIKKSDISTYGWDANPWVWVIEFERCEKPKDN